MVDAAVSKTVGAQSPCRFESGLRHQGKFTMRFVYPAQLERYSENEVVVSFRDVPWCHTSGVDVDEALAEAADALEEAIAGCINHGYPIPMPSASLPGEHLVALPIDMAAKAALALAFRASDL